MCKVLVCYLENCRETLSYKIATVGIAVSKKTTLGSKAHNVDLPSRYLHCIKICLAKLHSMVTKCV